MTQRYIDLNLFNQSIFPQYKNFCGVCSIIAVVNSELNTNYTQDSLHQAYKAGSFTKRQVSHEADPSSEDLTLVDPKGMSNFDIIRIFNSVMLDHQHRPYSALLTGKNFTSVPTEVLCDWFKQTGNYLIFHTQNHYFPIIGFVQNKQAIHWVRSDSSYQTNQPVFSTLHDKFQQTAALSNKYGFILLSSSPIEMLNKYIQGNNEDVFPIESTKTIRLQRYAS